MKVVGVVKSKKKGISLFTGLHLKVQWRLFLKMMQSFILNYNFPILCVLAATTWRLSGVLYKFLSL
jgi:hypothetical protein